MKLTEIVALFLKLKIAYRLHIEGINEKEILGESVETLGTKYSAIIV